MRYSCGDRVLVTWSPDHTNEPGTVVDGLAHAELVLVKIDSTEVMSWFNARGVKHLTVIDLIARLEAP